MSKQDGQDDGDLLAAPQGVFGLARLPLRRNLRAWDAADEYLLGHLAERDESTPIPLGSLVLVNDGFGALACALADHQPISWSDSFLAHRATSANLRHNGIDVGLVENVASTQDPDLPQGSIGILLIKVPKTLALLEYQLGKLRPFLSPDTVIIGAGMSKHIHTSTLDVFQRIIGPTKTSLAKKKARLAFVTFDPSADTGPSLLPTSYEFGPGLAAVTYPGVFAQRRLDIGTRFLLKHLPVPADDQAVLDLGCGNGIVGVSLARANPRCQVSFVDVSYLAIASAKATLARAFPDGRLDNGNEDRFMVGDGAEGITDRSVDLVVINPPFHDQFVVGDAVARQMFADARRVLRPGGQLWIVGNRHLGHHVKINQLFGNVRTVASNNKFVVLQANQS